MSVFTIIAIPADAFLLEAALSENPDLNVRLERAVPTKSSFVPYFWVADHSIEAIEAALRADADIDSFEIVDSVAGENLVRASWASGVDGFLDALTDADGTILEGTAEAGSWRFSLRFPGHDDLSTFYRGCVDHGISVDVETVHNPGVPEMLGLDFDVTEPQRDALVTALDEGYYDVPRGINLTELADRLGLSDTAVSQRLRRGSAALLRNTLVEGGADAESDDDGE
ncbi:bacterio-opsin activator domain-containing protein [Haloarcula onubensis]|uniref:Helix-turn-helix domain-containing protein n=1 Tax=Haloarcula onubensis TaxID=2950539 RepID=A0ABU2FMW8_9EURY|nr:bacterio-opsin activator domain-containing protein [Halomicroarcula sp. S3CR25-11]MDS0282093.1 helix-turn-helix domain-containing protein [Halomicroarcula sp. S3CR25-11]